MTDTNTSTDHDRAEEIDSDSDRDEEGGESDPGEEVQSEADPDEEVQSEVGSDEEGRPTVLVPLAVLEGESLPGGVDELLANAHVVLLGYHVIPDQTATEQAREQFGETGMSKLDEYAATLTEAGADVETRLVFTHEKDTTIDRIIYEHDCLAVLAPNSTERVESVLVAVRGTVGVGRNTRLVAGLFADTDVAVTLYHVLDEGETAADGESFINGVKTELEERGMDPDAIETLVEEADAAIEAIADRGENHDAVVMGETDPTVTTFVFGMPSEQVADRFLGPVLVVQRERPEE